MPTDFSKDYVHDGVVEAISLIAKAGCRIFYLSARPITWVARTREFLQSVGENGARLPEGALVTMKHSTKRSLTIPHEEFKSRVLRKVAALFQRSDIQRKSPGPFVAGFGNQLTDANAYASAGIPHDRIFLIDSTSKLTVYGTKAEHQSYRGLLTTLRQIFPEPAGAPTGTPCAAQVRNSITEQPPNGRKGSADPPPFAAGWGASLLGNFGLNFCCDSKPPPQPDELIAPDRSSGGGVGSSGGGGGPGGGGWFRGYEDGARAREAGRAQGGSPWQAGGGGGGGGDGGGGAWCSWGQQGGGNGSSTLAMPRSAEVAAAVRPRREQPQFAGHGWPTGPDPSAAVAASRREPGPAEGR